MKKYTIYIEEKLCKGTDVEADSMEEAMEKVKAMYQNSEIVLTSDDMGTDAEMMGVSEDGTESTEWDTF